MVRAYGARYDRARNAHSPPIECVARLQERAARVAVDETAGE
jgi:hypothetical protein